MKEVIKISPKIDAEILRRVREGTLTLSLDEDGVLDVCDSVTFSMVIRSDASPLAKRKHHALPADDRVAVMAAVRKLIKDVDIELCRFMSHRGSEALGVTYASTKGEFMRQVSYQLTVLSQF